MLRCVPWRARQSLMAGLMYHQPDDPITFLQECLDKVQSNPPSAYAWNLFVGKRRQRKAPSRVQTGQHRKPPAKGGMPLAPLSPSKGKPLTPAHGEGKARTPLPPIHKKEGGVLMRMRLWNGC